MDHQDVRELLEDAAIEPDGIDRLMAGDTPNAALAASHLAGCPDCAEELARLHRAVGLIRPVVRSVPPPELRARTLAHVAAVGRPRGLPELARIDERTPAIAPPPAIALSPGLRPTARPAAGPKRFAALTAIAAALIVAVAATGLLVNADRDDDARRQASQIEALADIARWTLRVDAAPDARRIELASTSGAATTGTLVFSPSSTELVVVAEQLPAPPSGREYRCWVEVGGSRTSVGKMYFGGDLSYWVGAVSEVAGLGPDVRFGVSLVDLTRPDLPGEPVLTGTG
ncbi:MAG: anti-sigma factor [Chloroflexi bacterium]|nr:anti-sigma factor [Chloroflexota bacterium]